MIQLFLSGKEVDITKSVGLYLNKSFNNLENPTLYYSEFSKTITLPFTTKNKQILENYCRQDMLVTTNSIDVRKKSPFQLLYNSKLIMEGYFKINNANTVYDDNSFQIELYSSFALIINELKQLTFNPYEVQSHGGEKEDKYLITSPFTDIIVDRNIVKSSFEQKTHDIDSNDILDWIKFLPTYQGKYKDFTSNKVQTTKKYTKELQEERDEHFMREYRSYYQQPALWVDKMWKMLQDKIEEITDYSLILDKSWFNTQNPYYTSLLYTCPSLYSNDDNFVEQTTVFDPNSKNYEYNITTMGNLCQNHEKKLFFNPNGVNYRNGIFNPDSIGYTKVSLNTSIQFLAYYPVQTYSFAKLKRGNPLYVTFRVRRQSDNAILNKKTYLIYSQQTPRTGALTYDEKVDVGVTSRFHPNMRNGFPTGYSNADGFWWEAILNVSFEVRENTPYYITCDCTFANNSKAVHWGYLTTPNKASFIYNLFTTGNKSGYVVFSNLQNGECKTIDYIRSRSNVDIYRLFSKDTTLLSVLLNYCKMYGLLWDVDIDNRTVTVCTRNKYFSNYKILDWSKKVDRKHDFILEPVFFNKRYVTFNFEDGRGPKFENYKKKYNYSYGSKKIDTEFQFNSDTEDLFKGIQPSLISQKAQSSVTFNIDKPSDPNYVGYNYKVYPDEHYIDNDNEGSNAENSGGFYFFNGVFSPDSKLGYNSQYGYPIVYISDDTLYEQSIGEYFWNQTGENVTLCHYLPDISTIDKTGKYSVHFESPKEYYYKVDTNDTDYVYSLFWEEFINERYNIQNKKLTAYFYLSPEEYDNIKFKDFVMIDNTIYHINKVIDYDYDTNSPCKIELIQVWDITKYTNGQKYWKVLNVTPDIIEINNQEWREVSVFCSEDDNWTVNSIPSWIDYQIEGNWLKLKASSNPLRSRTAKIELSTDNIHPLYADIQVIQKPNNVYLNINKNTITVSGDGASVQLEVDSRPLDIEVTKPNWVSDVSIISRELVQKSAGVNVFDDPQLKAGDYTISFTVNKNLSTLNRRGVMTITNGYVSKDFTIIQLGQPIIYEDWTDEPINISIGNSGNLNLITNKELDINSVDITNLGTITKPADKVDSVSISFSPQLDSTDYGDGTIETCTGGIVAITTLDGIKVNRNYNYGTIIPSYSVNIGCGINGHISIGGVDYYSNYIADIISGDSISVTAIPDTDYSFVSWSDGDTNQTRTITVNGNINIYPIFEDSGNRNYLFDNNEEIDFDNNENIIY